MHCTDYYHKKQSTLPRAPASGRRGGGRRTRLKSCSGWQMVVHTSHSRAKNRRLPARRHARQTATASNSCAARSAVKRLAGRHTVGCGSLRSASAARRARRSRGWTRRRLCKQCGARGATRHYAVVPGAQRIGVYMRVRLRPGRPADRALQLGPAGSTCSTTGARFKAVLQAQQASRSRTHDKQLGATGAAVRQGGRPNAMLRGTHKHLPITAKHKSSQKPACCTANACNFCSARTRACAPGAAAALCPLPKKDGSSQAVAGGAWSSAPPVSKPNPISRSKTEDG